jgi:hypothetical protein
MFVLVLDAYEKKLDGKQVYVDLKEVWGKSGAHRANFEGR